MMLRILLQSLPSRSVLSFMSLIEYIVIIIMSIEEYKSRGKDDPFKYEVERHGIVLYRDPKSEKEIIKD